MRDKRQICKGDCPEYALLCRDFVLHDLEINDLCLRQGGRMSHKRLREERREVTGTMYEMGVSPKDIGWVCNQSTTIIGDDTRELIVLPYRDEYGIAHASASQIAVIMREYVIERDGLDRDCLDLGHRKYHTHAFSYQRCAMGLAMKRTGLCANHIENAMGLGEKCVSYWVQREKSQQTSATSRHTEQLSAG